MTSLLVPHALCASIPSLPIAYPSHYQPPNVFAGASPPRPVLQRPLSRKHLNHHPSLARVFHRDDSSLWRCLLGARHNGKRGRRRGRRRQKGKSTRHVKYCRSTTWSRSLRDSVTCTVFPAPLHMCANTDAQNPLMRALLHHHRLLPPSTIPHDPIIPTAPKSIHNPTHPALAHHYPVRSFFNMFQGLGWVNDVGRGPDVGHMFGYETTGSKHGASKSAKGGKTTATTMTTTTP